jgi:hypothetical protein
VDGALGRWLRPSPLAEQLRAAGVREDLVQAAERTAFGRQSGREVVHLPAILDDDEVVVHLLEGRHRKAIGLLVLTSRRIVFAPKAAYREAALIIDRADVISATGRAHRGLSVLTLSTRGGDVVVDQILGTQGETFAEKVVQASTDSPAPVRDPLIELAELRALHHAGAIDDAEFRIRKSHLFDQI